MTPGKKLLKGANILSKLILLFYIGLLIKFLQYTI